MIHLCSVNYAYVLKIRYRFSDWHLLTGVWTKQFSVMVTKAFIDYIKSRPIVFDVFGHAQHSTSENGAVSAPTKWDICHTCGCTQSIITCCICIIFQWIRCFIQSLNSADLYSRFTVYFKVVIVWGAYNVISDYAEYHHLCTYIWKFHGVAFF